MSFAARSTYHQTKVCGRSFVTCHPRPKVESPEVSLTGPPKKGAVSSTPPFTANPLAVRSLLPASLPLESFEEPLSFCHVFDLIPNIKTYLDRGVLGSRHGDTIAGPRIDLDDLLLLRFVLRAEDKSRKIGAVLQVVDDYPINLRSERSQYVC
jgi:hypothetical protein